MELTDEKLAVFRQPKEESNPDSTFKSVGFDEVRVRYRKKRREMLSEIILSQLHGDLLEKYISSQVIEHVAEKDQKAFIHDIHEDLDLMDEIRIVVLDVTLAELKTWREAANFRR